VRRELLDDRRRSNYRRSPDEEYCLNSIEGLVERRRYGEVADDDLGARGECCVFRLARERANGHVATQKLVDDETPDATRCANHKDWIRGRVYHAQNDIGSSKRIINMTCAVNGRGVCERPVFVRERGGPVSFAL
jgi:hypothetical protein